jgi:hypothetical protein
VIKVTVWDPVLTPLSVNPADGDVLDAAVGAAGRSIPAVAVDGRKRAAAISVLTELSTTGLLRNVRDGLTGISFRGRKRWQGMMVICSRHLRMRDEPV